MHVQYKIIPYSGFSEKVQSVDADVDAVANAGQNLLA